MSGTNTKPLKKQNTKNADNIKKATVYADTAKNAMDDVTKFDSMIIKSNDDYLEKLAQADKIEYDILKENMAKAETAEERQVIRDRMAEMKKERYAKDTENKTFYENQQTEHKNYTLRVLGSVAVVTGLVYKFRKPIADFGKALITKK